MQRYLSEGYLANWAARLFFQAMDRALKGHGLTPAYVPVLLTLSEAGEITQSRLAGAIAIEQPTMAATLGRMERDGLLERWPDPTDRRKSLIGLSALGRAKVDVVKAAVREINSNAMAGFSPEDRLRHRKHMLQIITNLGGKPD